MKWLKRIGTTLLLIILAVGAFSVWFIGKSVPVYEGEIDLEGNKEEVVCTFDSFGIPHIQSNSSQDAYRALGYVMASERLFQMELLRRVGKGTLAEALGRPGVQADVFFRTTGISQYCKASADAFQKNGDPEVIAECESFLDGINQFQAEGKMPLEFSLAGIEPTPYTFEDMFAIAGYMAYSFSLGVRTDLLANELAREHGTEWLKETGLMASDLPPFQPVCLEDTLISGLFTHPLEELGIPQFNGSNAWAVAGSKTTNGKPILCNDTHIGYAMPQVWYEAAISIPGLDFYGNFIPGIPYGLVGHTQEHAWGMTMFENDDIDFYRERADEDGNYLFGEEYLPPVVRNETIKIKGEADSTFVVKTTINGPVINGAVDFMGEFPDISIRWDYLEAENQLIDAFRSMARSQDLSDFESAVALIHGPGLNCIYADNDDHIAWWACAKIVDHPDHVNPKTVIDGSEPSNRPLGYRPFSQNPHCIDPESGYLSSANERPEMPDSLNVYGYYVPPSRGERIRKKLAEKDNWDVDQMKSLMLDVINEDDAEIAWGMYAILAENDTSFTPYMKECMNLLQWDGSYATEASAPVLFQPLQTRLLFSAMQDKMTEGQFDRYLQTHWMRRGMHIMLKDPQHMIWDIRTTDKVETMEDHLLEVFTPLCEKLAVDYGKQTSNWKWGKVHQWQPKHLFADQPIVGTLLSAEPYPMFGANETISQSGFHPTLETNNSVRFGAQMRIIIDMSEPDKSISVSPTGQSGHLKSPHYLDQQAIYASGEFRAQNMQPEPNGKKLVFK